jgi:hypothetical protein
MKRLLTLTGVLLLLFYVTGVYGAGVEKKIYYEKKTTLSYPKKYTIRFSLWNDPTSTDQSSSMVWSEEKEVTLTTAKVRTYLGDTSPLDNVDFSEQLYVQVERKKADGTYVMIGTRDKFSVVPYALWSANGYQNARVVAKKGGQFTSIQSALDSITDASDTNRYLVKVMPGVYNERVTMKPYVDIEGSGELTTKITYTGSDSLYTGTVIGASNAELRFLTVENTGGGMTCAVAIYNYLASPRLTHVTATATGGTNNLGMFNDSSSPVMTNVTATATGGTYNNYGVYNSSSSPVMTNVTSTATGGTYSYGVYNYYSSSPVINNSQIKGTTNSVYNSSSTAKIGASKLDGATSGTGITCAGVYDANYTFYASTCP